MSKLPNIEMEIDQNVGLDEKDYLKKPEIALPSSKPKEKKKRVVSQKQLDALAKAREKSIEKRKLIREQKEKEKADKKKEKADKKERNRPPIVPTIKEESEEEEEERADTPEALIDVNSVDYSKVISGVFDLIQADKEKRRPEKEAKYKQMFNDAESARIDERKKLLDLVYQMDTADKVRKAPAPKKEKPKKQVNATKIISRGQPDWDSCFAPRRGNGNFF